MTAVLVIGEILEWLGVQQSIAAIVIGGIVLWKMRRAQSYGAAAVGIASSGATVVGGIIAFAVLAVAAGWWDPPLGQMVGDLLNWARAAWDFGLEWAFSKLVDVIEGVADGG